MVNNNMTFKCLCTVVLLCACCILIFAQERYIHDSVFLPELTIKNQEMCQYIANRLKKNKITNDTLFLEVRKEIYYLDKPIWIRKLYARLGVEVPGRKRAQKLNRTVLFLLSSENYNHRLLGYIDRGIPNINGYFYIDEVCIIVYDGREKDCKIGNVGLIDSTLSGEGRYFTDSPDKRSGIKVGLCSIEMDYFIKDKKLKKIYEYVEK